MISSVTHLVIELVPLVQKTAIYRSLPIKVVTLLLHAFFAILLYEVRIKPNTVRHSFIPVFLLLWPKDDHC